MADVVKSMSHAMARAMEEEVPQCHVINISSGEDVMSDDDALWAWAQHMAEGSPHTVAEVQ